MIPFSKYHVIKYYCLVFYALMLYKWLQGMWLYQMQPSFFYTRQDVVTWLFMLTHLHLWLLNNHVAWFALDMLFYTMPLLYFLSYFFLKKYAGLIAFTMLIINWSYVQCYTLYATNSIEGHIAWLLFPIIFLTEKKMFSLLFLALRYLLLFFFASAGIWKFIQGGIFHTDEMSGILLYQHAQLLSGSPEYFQSKFILWLIRHQIISYLLYVFATLVELSFIIGFFTRRFDKILLLLSILFLVMDFFIMRIVYFDIAPLLLTLCFAEEKNIVRKKVAA